MTQKTPLTVDDTVCSCYENWGHSDSGNPICDMPICPWNNTDTPCGNSTGNGVCIYSTDPATRTIPGYLGHCRCREGFTGIACDNLVCPIDPATSLICGGFNSDQENTPPGNYSAQGRATSCDEVNQMCRCETGEWRNGALGFCELRSCPWSRYGDETSECNGVKKYSSGSFNSTFSNVCDRSTGSCQCFLHLQPCQTDSVSGDDARFGDTCQYFYNDTSYSKCVSSTGNVKRTCNGVGSCGYFTTTSPKKNILRCIGDGVTIPDNRNYDWFKEPISKLYLPPDSVLQSIDTGNSPTCGGCTAGWAGDLCAQSACSLLSPDPTHVCWDEAGHHTGDCNSYLNGVLVTNPSLCISGNCQSRCDCLTVDLNNNSYAACSTVAGPSSGQQCATFTDWYVGPDGSTVPLNFCKINRRNCTVWTSDNKFVHLCGPMGDAACKLSNPYNPESQSYCDCGIAYSGQQCETKEMCGGKCLYPQGQCQKDDTCTCSILYDNNPSDNQVCDQLRCQANPYPGIILDSTNGKYCLCPTGSTYKSKTYWSGVGLCQPKIASDKLRKGCYKVNCCIFFELAHLKKTIIIIILTQDCPVSSVTGIECGSCVDGFSRCSSHSVLGNITNSVSCDCSTFAPDPQGYEPSKSVRWVNSTDGSCEPYCLHGAKYTDGGTCDCTTAVIGGCQWTGDRCNVSKCQNDGIMNVGGDCNCFCGPDPKYGNGGYRDFPYTSGSFCTVSACVAPIAYYNASIDLNNCQCKAPYIRNTNKNATDCINPCKQGTVNITLGICNCSAFYYGDLCDQTDCNTILGNVCQCDDDKYYNTSTHTCQYTYQCQNGGCRKSDPGGCPHSTSTKDECACPYGFEGHHCEINYCATNGGGCADPNGCGLAPSGCWGLPGLGDGQCRCSCYSGYTNDPTNRYICTDNKCRDSNVLGFGNPIDCNPDAQSGPTKCKCNSPKWWNCDCGIGTFNSDGSNCGCIFPVNITSTIRNCVNGGYKCGFGVPHVTANFSLQCVCQKGYITDTDSDAYKNCGAQYCSKKICPSVHAYYNTSSTMPETDCVCYEPWSVPPTCTSYAACGTGGLIPTTGTSSYCNCKDGYIIRQPSSSKTPWPCVKNCSEDGTKPTGWNDNSCTCLKGCTGDFCETCSVPNTVVTTPVSSSSSLATWAIAVIAVISSLVVISSLYFVYWKYYMKSTTYSSSSTAGKYKKANKKTRSGVV